MTRRLVNLVTLLSLILCATTVVFGLRSFWRFDMAQVMYRWKSEGIVRVAYLSIASRPHCVQWAVGLNTHQDELGETSGLDWDVISEDHTRSHPPSRWVRLGFGMQHQAVKVDPAEWTDYGGPALAPYRNHSFNAAAPPWFLALVTAALPARRAWPSLRSRRLRRGGRCPSCGYNLAGNVSGVCPECGTPGS